MYTNDSHRFPGRWGELADLLRQAHASLRAAESTGADRNRVVELSRVARQAVREAGTDVDRAVVVAEQLVADAASLLDRGAGAGPSGGGRTLTTQAIALVDIGLDRQSVLPS